jgi:cytoskeletal protein CcmA (bactofilin family)
MSAKKALFILFPLSIFLAFALPVSAAEFKAGEAYALQKSETVFNDLYAAGGTVVIAGDVEGDLTAAGGDITVTGRVAQDAILAGGSVSLSGILGDDLRAAGGRIQVTGKVGGDAVVAGGQVYFVSGSSVAGDMIVSGGGVIADAAVGGRVKIVAREVTVNGPVAGDVHITADRIVIGKKTLISGNFTYKSRKEAEIKAGAVIKGETAFERMEAPSHRVRTGAFLAAWTVGRYLMLLTAALIAVLLFKRLSQGVVERALGRFGRELLTGFIVLIVVPAAVLLCFITVIGVPIGLAGLFAYFLLFILSSVYAGVVVGSLIQKALLKRPSLEASWKTALIGVTVYTVAGLIPFLGWLFKFAFFLAALGVMSRIVYEKIGAER